MDDAPPSPSSVEADPIWNSSYTARQIRALGDVEKDISRMLMLASNSLSLLTLPQTDEPDDGLPQTDERSEQFVAEVTQYFETLDNVQFSLRTCLAQLRRDRVAPSSIDAVPPNFVPPSFGVGLPNDPNAANSKEANKSLQEIRVERDAWKGVLNALQRLKAAKAKERENGSQDTLMDTS
ncbi:hypothetical protein M422DRAFT_57872 [Sphaerobolus stellatus SS14]|nr:hypothetical protein M422DRAFT_57872 [Sphaerobolus stellatus SS14]